MISLQRINCEPKAESEPEPGPSSSKPWQGPPLQQRDRRNSVDGERKKLNWKFNKTIIDRKAEPILMRDEKIIMKIQSNLKLDIHRFFFFQFNKIVPTRRDAEILSLEWPNFSDKYRSSFSTKLSFAFLTQKLLFMNPLKMMTSQSFSC